MNNPNDPPIPDMIGGTGPKIEDVKTMLKSKKKDICNKYKGRKISFGPYMIYKDINLNEHYGYVDVKVG